MGLPDDASGAPNWHRQSVLTRPIVRFWIRISFRAIKAQTSAGFQRATRIDLPDRGKNQTCVLCPGILAYGKREKNDRYFCLLMLFFKILGHIFNESN
jgi:hypothetical protein